LPGNLVSASLIQRMGPARLCTWSLSLAAVCTTIMSITPARLHHPSDSPQQQYHKEHRSPQPSNAISLPVTSVLHNNRSSRSGSVTAAVTAGEAVSVISKALSTRPPTAPRQLFATNTTNTSADVNRTDYASSDAGVASKETPFVFMSLVTLALACGFNACATSAWNALDIISAEVFPSALRSTALGLLASSGRVASMAAQWVNAELIEEGIVIMLLVTGGGLIIAAVGVHSVPIGGTQTRSTDAAVVDMAAAVDIARRTKAGERSGRHIQESQLENGALLSGPSLSFMLERGPADSDIESKDGAEGRGLEVEMKDIELVESGDETAI